MDSPIPQVTLNGSANDQSVSQGLSSIKKRGRGDNSAAGIFNLIGGPGSFASLLGQNSVGSWLEKGDSNKQGSASFHADSAAGGDEFGKTSTRNISGGRESFYLKEHMGMEAMALGGQISSEKNVINSSEIPLTGNISDAKMGGKGTPEMSGKTHCLEGEEISDESDAANLPKGSYLQGGEALPMGSTSERGRRSLLKQGTDGVGSLENSVSGDSNYLASKAGSESAALSSDGLKGINLTRKNTTDGMSGVAGDELEGQKRWDDLGLSKGSDAKGSSISKVSLDLKDSDMQSVKDGAPHSSDIAKDSVTSSSQTLAETEKTQVYKNLSIDGLKSEKTLNNSGANENATGKSGASSLLAAQADFSMAKGVWNVSGTNVNDRIATPLSFQDVASQVLDGASNMLNKGSGRMVITLEPPNLGTLNMDVRVQHDTVRMLLTTDNNEVKQVLHANLDQLKTALQGHGLNIDRFDVLVHDKSYDGNQGFQPGGGALFEEGRGSGDDAKDNPPPPHVSPLGVNEVSEPSSGIISLFA